MRNIYQCCLWSAPVIHARAFIFPILPCHFCWGSSDHVERACVVFIMADSRGHRPDPCWLRHAGNFGPGRHVAARSRSRVWSHCGQVEGQVLRTWVLQSRLHHVLGVMLIELGSSFSSILQRQRLRFSILTIGSHLDIPVHIPSWCFVFPLRSQTGL